MHGSPSMHKCTVQTKVQWYNGAGIQPLMSPYTLHLYAHCVNHLSMCLPNGSYCEGLINHIM